jgi:zinc transporter ZupT
MHFHRQLAFAWLSFHPLQKLLAVTAAVDDESFLLRAFGCLLKVGIGLGFQVSAAVGLIVSIAVISHDFSDGLNTVTLMIINKNTPRRSFLLLLADAAAPVAGAISTLFFTIPTVGLPYYLGFFAGFLLYIGASDILPQAHSNKSTAFTVALTVLGVFFAFVVTRFV